MQPPNTPPQRAARISCGSTQLLVGPASCRRWLQMKVRSSTRATSLGIGEGQEAVGALGGVEAAGGCRRRPSARRARSFSAAEPSHQWIAVGLGQRRDLGDPRLEPLVGHPGRRIECGGPRLGGGGHAAGSVDGMIWRAGPGPNFGSAAAEAPAGEVECSGQRVARDAMLCEIYRNGRNGAASGSARPSGPHRHHVRLEVIGVERGADIPLGEALRGGDPEHQVERVGECWKRPSECPSSWAATVPGTGEVGRVGHAGKDVDPDRHPELEAGGHRVHVGRADAGGHWPPIRRWSAAAAAPSGR